MPRYFFHARCGRSAPDASGVDLSDLEEAKRMAAWYLADLISSDPEALWSGGARIDVAGADGRTLFTASACQAEADQSGLAGWNEAPQDEAHSTGMAYPVAK